MTVARSSQLSLGEQLSYALTAPELADPAKRLVSEYIRQQAAAGGHSAELVVQILDVASHSALHGPSPLVRTAALDVYNGWASANACLITDYIQANECERLFNWLGLKISKDDEGGSSEGGASDAGTSMGAEGPQWQGAREHVFTVLHATISALAALPDKQMLVVRDICLVVAKYIKGCISDVLGLASVAKFLLESGAANKLSALQKEPRLRKCAQKLCKRFVRCVAFTKEHRSFLAAQSAAISTVTKMLRCFWPNDEHMRSTLTSVVLIKIFNLGMQAGSGQPLLLLAPILQTIPINYELASYYSKLILASCDESYVINLLQRIIAWMKWPQQTAVSIWAMAMWDSVVQLRVNTVIEQVSPEIEKLIKYLQVPYIRASSARLLEKIFAVQKGPGLFHKALPNLVLLVRNLWNIEAGGRGFSKSGCTSDDKTAAKNREESAELAIGIANFICQEMKKYPGYPDLYREAKALIHNLPVPDQPSDQDDIQLDADDLDYVDVKQFGKTGLINPDQLSCYANAVLQMLFASTRFRNDVLRASGTMASRSRSEAGAQPMLSQLQQVFAFLAFSERACYDAHEFRATSQPPGFAESEQQQDSWELLSYIQDQLNEQELANRRRCAATIDQSPSRLDCLPLRAAGCSPDAASEPSEAADPSAATVPVAGAECEPAAASSDQQQPTLCAKYFHGCIMRQYRCLECGFVSQGFEPLLHLPLYGLPEDDKDGSDSETETVQPPIALASLIERELGEERMVNDDQWYCSRCQCHRDTVRSSQVTSAPDHLIVIICRFKYDRTTKTSRKKCTGVNCCDRLLLPIMPQPPVATTDALADTRDSCSFAVEYKLRAVVVHRGRQLQNGHYLCFAKHDSADVSGQNELSAADEGKWFIFDDKEVTPTGFNCIPGNGTVRTRDDTPYILLYERAVTTTALQATGTTPATRAIATDAASNRLTEAEAVAAAPDCMLNILMDLVKIADTRTGEEVARIQAIARSAKLRLRHYKATTSSCKPQLQPTRRPWSSDDDEDDDGGSRKYSAAGNSNEQMDISGAHYVC